jgi:hypothetical protein
MSLSWRSSYRFSSIALRSRLPLLFLCPLPTADLRSVFQYVLIKPDRYLGNMAMLVPRILLPPTHACRYRLRRHRDCGRFYHRIIKRRTVPVLCIKYQATNNYASYKCHSPPVLSAPTILASCMLAHYDACKITFGRRVSNSSGVLASPCKLHHPVLHRRTLPQHRSSRRNGRRKPPAMASR